MTVNDFCLTVPCRLVSQVTRGMFGANRKKFMEGGIESDYPDDSSLYYSQQSMFPPHRADKDVSPARSGIITVYNYCQKMHLRVWTCSASQETSEVFYGSCTCT